MIFYTLIALLISLCIAIRWKNRKFHEISKILGNSSVSLPVLGVSHLFVGNGEVVMRGIETLGREVVEKKTGLMAVWLGHRFFVVIGDPEIAEHVSKTCLEKHDIMSKCMGLVLSKSSIVAPVTIWRAHRRILTPTFGTKTVRKYFSIFTKQSNILVQQLKKQLNSPIPILEHYMKYSMEALCQTTLGVQLDVQRQPTPHPFIVGLEEVGCHIGERFLKPWLSNDFIYKLLPSYRTTKNLRKYADCFLDEIIQFQRQRNRVKASDLHIQQKGKSLIELLVEVSESDKYVSDEEMRDEALGVAVAGTDTTAISSGFLSCLLAEHPDVQEKIFDELNNVFGNEGSITLENLSRLNYLNAVIKEALILYPPAPIIVRQVEKSCELPSGVVLPAGCGVLLHLSAINRNPEYWGADADQFRPERFLDSSPKHPAQFSTFSFGPRNCIGKSYAMMSLKTMFATILRHFRFAPASGSGCTTEPAAKGLRLTYSVTMKDVNNFPVQIQMRNL